MPTTSSNSSEPPVEQNLDTAKLSVDHGEQATNSISSTDSGHCSAQCSSSISMLDDDLELNDDTFDKLEAHAQEIATYLANNDGKRQHYIQMALTTTDGDKRAFLSDVFKYLPDQQKAEIGESFISSENWRVRVDGVTLIASHDRPHADVTNTLVTLLAHEENAYVKSRILAYLKQSPALHGDIEILHQLDSSVYNDTNTSVRVSALKAKMQLSEQPYHVLPDALQALRSSEPELQFAGLIAIEKILKNEQAHIENGVYIDKHSIKNDIQLIRNMDAYGDNKKQVERLTQEADAVYSRYFEH